MTAPGLPEEVARGCDDDELPMINEGAVKKKSAAASPMLNSTHTHIVVAPGLGENWIKKKIIVLMQMI